MVALLLTEMAPFGCLSFPPVQLRREDWLKARQTRVYFNCQCNSRLEKRKGLKSQCSRCSSLAGVPLLMYIGSSPSQLAPALFASIESDWKLVFLVVMRLRLNKRASLLSSFSFRRPPGANVTDLTALWATPPALYRLWNIDICCTSELSDMA